MKIKVTQTESGKTAIVITGHNAAASRALIEVDINQDNGVDTEVSAENLAKILSMNA